MPTSSTSSASAAGSSSSAGPSEVRPATVADLQALLELESHWPSVELKSSEDVIRRRIRAHPAGQLIALSLDGTPLGVIYTQRVASQQALLTTTRESEPALHTPNGPVVQLLGVIQRPHARVGGLLRDHLLSLARLDTTVECACGITRCRAYDASRGKGYQAHINEGSDPGLLFHTQAGAHVAGLVPGYRPCDTMNLGYGVLVCYDVHDDRLNEAYRPKSVAECVALICECIGRMDVVRYRGRAFDSSMLRVGFMDLGLDSLDAVTLVQAVNARLGSALKLSDTVAFEHPNVEKLATFIFDSLTDTRARAAWTSAGEHVRRRLHHFIAGGVAQWAGSDHAASWGLSCLHAGGDAVGEVPLTRWEAELSPPPVRHGAFIAHAEFFDDRFFSISPAEAAAMDPQQRLLLERGYAALHSVERRSEDLGIFLGLMNSDFAMLPSVRGDSAYEATGGALSIAAGRLSFVLGSQGPCASVDTACSSALVAMHWAALALTRDECSSALCLAANLMLAPRVHHAYARAGMLSNDGRCKTFDARANGYVRGEGVGGMVLCCRAVVGKAVVLASRVRSDGRSASLTAPNGAAQTRMIGEALAAACSHELHLVETHGTGTKLGDPIEVASLGRSLGEAAPCFGSAKASVGHAESAAGLAGVMALLVQTVLRAAGGGNAQLRALNQLLSAPLNMLQAQVPTQGLQLVKCAVRSGVSSFGYSGTIAHAVLRRADVSLVLPASPSSPLRMRRRAFPWRETLEQHRLPPSRACAADTPLAQPRRVRERVGQLVRLSLASDAQVAVLELCDVANFNALSLELMSELSLAISHVGLLVDVRAIVLQAAGPHFCIGAHPHQRPDENVPIAALAERLLTLSRCCCSLRHLAAPVLAAVHGHVVGGGVALCLNASFLICTQTCTFEHGNLPRGEPRTGLSCARALSPGMQLTTCDECACRRVSARRLLADIGHSAWPSSGQRVLSDEHGAQCCSCVECWPGT